VSSPQSYAPRDPSLIDNIAYTQRVTESILRNNPLTDATVSSGLLRWIGNYVSGPGPDMINFLWIGEFFPADVNLGGRAQRGFSLVRDDSRGGVSAIAMFDPNPSASPGLKQVLFITSGDGKRIFTESRDGGQQWPEYPAMVVPVDPIPANWPTTVSATFQTLAEGRVSILGNALHYRVWGATDTGATGEFRVRVVGPSGDISGTAHPLAANTNGVFDSSFDVSAIRGNTCQIIYEARRTNAVGNVRATPISVSCYTG
jgi:hypothetical protein